MIRNLLARITILPTTFVIYKTKWFSKIRKPGFWKNLYKMETLPCPRSRNIFVNALCNYGFLFSIYCKCFGPKDALKRIVDMKRLKFDKYQIFNKIRFQETQTNAYSFNYKQVPVFVESTYDYSTTFERINKAIDSDRIKVISFDIFDTLLIRLVPDYRDIFKIVQFRISSFCNVDFFLQRSAAEEELKNIHCKLDDIYDYLRLKNNWSEELTKRIKEIELKTEKEFIIDREPFRELFTKAKKSGKLLFATTDMYLPKAFLENILVENGYSGVHVICSNEYKKRKDIGDLYDVLISESNCQPEQIVHIGDNYYSDYLKAIENNIVAIHLPSLIDSLKITNNQWKPILEEIIKSDDIAQKVLLWYAIVKCRDFSKSYGKKIFKDLESLSWLGIAPLTYYAVLKILLDKNIQTNYKNIAFSSRDGYLPFKLYEVLRKELQIGIPSFYFQAGRRAFIYSRWNSFSQVLSHEGISFEAEKEERYTFEDFVNEFIHSPIVRQEIFSCCDEELLTSKLKTLDVNNFPDIIQEKVMDFVKAQRERARDYYSQYFSDDKTIVFDLGYSGSVGLGIYAACNQAVDKIYYWKEASNLEKVDKKLNTSTYCLFSDLSHRPIEAFHLLIEELYSPLQGGCIGFDKNKKPIFESVSFSEGMVNDVDLIHSTCEKFAVEISNKVDIRDLIDFNKTGDLLMLPMAKIVESPFGETNYLANILYKDSFCLKQHSLAYKVSTACRNLPQTLGTGFSNMENYVNLDDYSDFDYSCNKILVHLHLYYIDLIQEICENLSSLECKFDLLVTTSNKDIEELISAYFMSNLANLCRLEVKLVPNRGRDVAPWIIETRSVANHYDFILHIHGKKSVHADSDYVTRWRSHLFFNLLNKNRVRKILSVLKTEKHIGMLFPKPYENVVNIWNDLNVPVMGSDEKLIEKLIEKLNQKQSYLSEVEEVLKTDLLFSVGTMFWYKPEALQNFYDLNMNYGDFPEEPIGIDGTIAHAIERSMSIICRSNGYQAKAYF